MKRVNEKFFINIISNLVLVGVLFLVVAVSFGGEIREAFTPSSGTAIYKGNTQKKGVSLMINVYWGNEYIPGMLDVLADNGVKATFFVGGSWANRYPELLKSIADGGHEIGNHGFFHKDQKKLSYMQNKEEILTCEKVVETLTGIKTNLFAPPSGSYSNNVLKAATDLGYRTIMWSKDTIDWRDKDDSKIFTRATNNAQGGDLVLMHPTQNTLNVLDKMIKYYIEKGLSVVTVSENLA